MPKLQRYAAYLKHHSLLVLAFGHLTAFEFSGLAVGGLLTLTGLLLEFLALDTHARKRLFPPLVFDLSVTKLGISALPFLHKFAWFPHSGSEGDRHCGGGRGWGGTGFVGQGSSRTSRRLASGGACGTVRGLHARHV